jgi:regulator of cell morphogenesis and NO signaling
MTTEITEDMSINQVLRLYPQVMGVFNTFRMDSCCGGARSLGQAALEDGADMQALLAALRQAAVSKV